MSDLQVTRNDPREMELSLGTYEEAYKKGTTFSNVLEERDPSHQYHDDPRFAGTDAFQRQLMFAGIVPSSDPERGVWSSEIGDFHKTERGAHLFPEWVSRQWRKVAYRGLKTDTGERFYASSDPVSNVLYPPQISTMVRQKQIAPAIPLSRIIAITTPVNAAAYQAFYLTDSTTERTMRRVAEGAEVPTAKLTGGDHTVRIRKYGRALEFSYETARYMRLDRFAIHLALLAVQAEVDKFATAIDVAINGDGNSSTAATNHNKTTMDTGLVAGDALSGKAYLTWRMQWANPYRCDFVLGREAEALQVFLMDMGSGNVNYWQLANLSGFGKTTPINPQLGPADVGWDSAAIAANLLLGLDSRFALEMAVGTGTTLTETDKLIKSQFNVIVMTEALGFAVFDANATKTLTLNA